MPLFMKAKRVQVVSKLAKRKSIPVPDEVEVPAKKAMPPMKGKAVEKAVEKVEAPAKKAMQPMKAKLVARKVAKATALKKKKEAAPEEVEVPAKKAMPPMKGKVVEKAVEKVEAPAKKAMQPMKAKLVVGKVAKATALKRKKEAAPEEIEVPAKKARVAKKPAAATAEPVKTPAAAKGAATKKSKQGAEQDAKATEDATIAARQKELKAMASADVKDLAKSLGLEAGVKTDMIEKILDHEAKVREALRAQEAKRQDIMKGRKSELAGKSAPELKELCENKGLKLGGSKEERVERLVNHARESGEIDGVLAAMARDVRRAELLSMQSNDLKKLCEKTGVDPLVKEIMVERLLLSEERSK